MKLYELTKELAVIEQDLITAEGEVTPELEARLNAVNLSLEQKAIGLRKYMANVESDISSIDLEIGRLINIRNIRQNVIARMETYIKNSMEANGIKKIESPIGTFTIAANPPSVEIVVPEMVPEIYTTAVTEIKINKADIKKAMLKGDVVPGCQLITNKTHLKIK